MLTISDKFKAVWEKPNPMTPRIDKVGSKGEFIWELSHGDGLRPGTTMWGVTVLTKEGKKTEQTQTLSSGGFPSKEEAMEYVDSLSDVELDDEADNK